MNLNFKHQIMSYCDLKNSYKKINVQVGTIDFWYLQYISFFVISGSRHAKVKEEDLEGFQPAMMSFKIFMQTQVAIPIIKHNADAQQ